MANRFNRKNPNMGQRRFNGYDNFSRPRYNVNPWQGGIAPNSGGGPSASNSDATIALASNLLNNILQSRQNPMPSLLDLNVRRDFGHPYMRDDRYGHGHGPGPPPPHAHNKIGRNMQTGGQMNRRINAGGRNDRGINKMRRPARPNSAAKPKPAQKTQEIEEAKTTESETPQVTVKAENGDAEEANNVAVPEDAAEKKTEEVKTEFDGILQDYLECHICEKKMWDGRSFDNHIKGRVHNIMMDKTKQSYMMTANAMRQELKINEMKRNKRGFAVGTKKVFCAMCDLFVYHAAAHRRSAGHQKLKKYLHPSCNTCRKEFPTRIELDEHRLTAPHLRLLQEKQIDVQSKPKPEVLMISTLQEELSLVRLAQAKKMVQKKNEENTNETVAEENKESDENQSSEIKTEDTENAETAQDDAHLLLDYKDGDDISSMTRENLPKYQPTRPVGMSFIAEFSCMHCTLCKKFFDTDETAEVHLRTWKHYHSYIGYIHSKGNFKTNSSQEGAVKRNLNDSIVDEESDRKRVKVEDGGEALNEEELLNGTDKGIVDEETGNDTIPEDSILGTDSESTSFNESANISQVEEVISQQEVPAKIETQSVKIEQPRSIRGRGRGRGPRGRRGARY